jgi:ParB/Sulfiredoxin domain
MSRTDQTTTAAKSWRDILPIHPAAELFPLMSPDELRALAEDIKANGLVTPVVLWRDDEGKLILLDGRNRLDAIEMVIGGPAKVNPWFVHTPPDCPRPCLRRLGRKHRHRVGSQGRSIRLRR